jgi:predicted phosphodiesterase
MILGWSDPRLTKTWVIPAYIRIAVIACIQSVRIELTHTSQIASKKANDVVYLFSYQEGVVARHVHGHSHLGRYHGNTDILLNS